MPKKYLGADGIGKLKELITAAFVSKSQGSQNAGKVLGVGADGSVVPTDSGIHITKLWENASPTSNFAEQTINLNLTPYKLLIFSTAFGTLYDTYPLFTCVRFTAPGCNAMIMGLQSNFFGTSKRVITLNDDSVAFSTPYMWYPGDEVTGDAQYCIPLEIYGIKEV